MFLNINDDCDLETLLGGRKTDLFARDPYSTVTDLARFFGLSISQPFSFAT